MHYVVWVTNSDGNWVAAAKRNRGRDAVFLAPRSREKIARVTNRSCQTRSGSAPFGGEILDVHGRVVGMIWQ